MWNNFVEHTDARTGLYFGAIGTFVFHKNWSFIQLTYSRINSNEEKKVYHKSTCDLSLSRPNHQGDGPC